MKDLFKNINIYWVFVGVFVTLVIWYANTNTTLADFKVTQQDNTVQIEQNTNTILSQKEDIGTLNANVFIICSHLNLNCIKPK